MKKDRRQDEKPYTGRAYAYISVGLIFAAAAFFGLAFTALGIYSLIASILLSLASLAFANVQKKKNAFNGLAYIRICACVVLAVTAGFFIGGIIWAAI